jgi:putative effector of murein hydrolase
MPDLPGLFWLLLTVAGYVVSRMLYARLRWYVVSPIIFVTVLLYAATLWQQVSYAEYAHYSHWLITLLGPATVAFAVPIWQQRRLLARYWQALLAGLCVGSGVAIGSSWLLARLLLLDDRVLLSMLPRSISTPFAMPMSATVGGVPELTAAFVMITGLGGAILGSLLIKLLPLKSALARGALFGMGAHGVGTSKAYEVGLEEGTVAGLVMVLAGLSNLLGAQLVLWLLRG